MLSSEFTPDEIDRGKAAYALSAAKAGFVRVGSYKDRPIDYIDPAPKPFEIQIPLVEYFERVKRYKADRWQVDFMDRLQEATVQRHNKRLWAIVHAEAQLGKSSILAQVYPAWLLGHDPLHRFALATYNATRSQSHAKVVIDILNLDIHKQIFPLRKEDEGTAKDYRVNPTASKERFKTMARQKAPNPEADESFNPVGLSNGLTGNGFDTLVIDDPYANEREAFSDAIRISLQSFWESTVNARMGEYSNVFGMFHRFHEQDLAGYLLDKDEGFDYWRYASECDGDYLHTSTGRLFKDPLGREIGQLISERRGESYYASKRKIPRIWNSMFQGKPASDSGDFFNIDRIITITDPLEAREEWAQCIGVTRSWDHAATDSAGDFTAGALMGIKPDGTIIVKDMKLVQMDSAERVAFQKKTADEDGVNTPICIPQEVGEAGKTLVFAMQQFLQGYTVIPRHVQTGTQSVTLGNNPKQRRAYNFSVAVNSGMVKFVEGEWNSETLRALKFFGFTTFDDPCDALGDGYNYLFETFHKGLVIKSQPIFRPWNEFEHGPIVSNERVSKIPKHWTVYAAIKLSDDMTFANSGVIIARAAENSGLKDTLFILAEYKEYDGNYQNVFTWLDDTLKECCEKPETTIIHLHKDSEYFLPTIRQKLKYSVWLFKEDSEAGLTETNWYLQNQGLIGLLADGTQLSLPRDRSGLKDLRQEVATWGYDEKGQPTKRGQVWDCVRMIAYRFRTHALGLTDEERIIKEMPEEVKPKPQMTQQEVMGFQRYMMDIQKKMDDKRGESGDFNNLDDWRGRV